MLATLVGMTFNVAGINPIKALDWTAVLNGVIVVPLMAVMMLIASRQDIMGRFPVRGWLRGGGWTATAIMGLAVLGILATSL